MIDLRSDTVTKPTPGMRRAMAAADVGDDVFGEDPTVNRLQDHAAELTGQEAALFVPSGIMANQLAIRLHTRPGDEVIVDDQAHIVHYEVGAGAALSGVQFRCLTGTRGLLTPEQVTAAIRPADPFLLRTSLICLEHTHNRGGGAIYPRETLHAIADVAAKRGVARHLDGARLFNASVATGMAPADYARPFDTVAFSLSKGLGAPVGSMLCTSRDRIPALKRLRRMVGGGMRQSGILAAAGLYALEHHVQRLTEDHVRAKQLANALADLPGVTINPDHVETNIVVFDIGKTRWTPPEAVEALKRDGVLVVPFGSSLLRAVTHLDVDQAAMDRAIGVFQRVFGQR